MQTQQNAEVAFFSFSGGRASSKTPSTLEANEASALDNIVLLPGEGGWRSRYGNTLVGALLNIGTSGQGLGCMKVGSTDTLVGVAGGQVYSLTSDGATKTNITGSVSITKGRTNNWSFHRLNSLLIGLGTDAPFKWTGSGNVAALAANPPGYSNIGMVYNNRLFVANGSTLYWPVLSNPEDWTGTGSGSATFDYGDNTSITACLPLNDDNALVFKSGKTFRLMGRTSPFPNTLLFNDVGCVGQNAAIVVDGLAYWIAYPGKMVISDGNTLTTDVQLPQLGYIGDLWGSISASNLPNLKATRLTGPDFDWIVWSVNKAGYNYNDYAIVWDLKHRCWLNCSSGFESNGYVTGSDGTVYFIGFDSGVYKLNAAGTYTDASNNSQNISWSWESDWISDGSHAVRNVNRVRWYSAGNSLRNVTQARWLNLERYDASGASLTVSHAADFGGYVGSTTLSLTPSGSAKWDTAIWGTSKWTDSQFRVSKVPITHRGNAIRVKFAGSDAALYKVNGFTLVGKQHAQKDFKAS